MLDALVDSSGRLADIKVVRGESPFLDKTLVAVRTWTFLPARNDGQVVETRIGIAFQFPQPYVPPRTATTHNYEDGSADSPEKNSAERGALPIVTVEPEYPSGTDVHGAVILSADISEQGRLDSVKILRGLDPLTPAAVAALRQWHFAPGKRAGAKCQFSRHSGVHVHSSSRSRSRASIQILAIIRLVPLQFHSASLYSSPRKGIKSVPQ